MEDNELTPEVEMGNAARLGLKHRHIQVRKDFFDVEMGNAARLGLKHAVNSMTTNN